MKRKRRNLEIHAGSITIEAAIVLPTVMLVMLFLVRMLQLHHASLLWEMAAEESIEESRMVLAVRGDQAHHDGDDDGGISIRDTLSGYLMRARHIRHFNKWQAFYPHYSGILQPLDVRLERAEHGYYLYQSRYRLNTGWYAFDRSYQTVLPVWAMALEQDATEEEEAIDTIWQQDNFTRGQYFRSKYGGNLPSNFRTLSGFHQGEARLIKSIDLTAQTWQSMPRLKREIESHLEALSGFEPSFEERTWITEPIQTRIYYLIIPTNSSPETIAYIEQWLVSWGMHYRMIRDEVSP